MTAPGVYKAIGFNMAGQLNLLKTAYSEKQTIDLLFSIEENEWKGTTTVELRARDIRPAASSTETWQSGDLLATPERLEATVR